LKEDGMTTSYAPGRGLPSDVDDIAPEGARLWWVFLVTGSLWLLFSLIVFRFDLDTVTAIGIAIGAFCIAAAVNELIALGATRGGWKVARVALAVLFTLIGILALAYPNRTFVEVAAIFSFFLLIKGSFDMVTALMLRKDMDLWWVPFVVGVAEILLAFWAAGNFGREAVLLVVWVGAAALARGVMEIVLAFRLREVGRKGAPGTPAPA
jgi:uncharacterized membrane protein HdeD (DUF308 family)